MFEIWIDRKGFKDTFSVLKGEKKLHPLFVELKDYIEKEFDIKVYNVAFEKHSIFSLSKHNKAFVTRGKKCSIKCYVSFKDLEKMQTEIPVDIPGLPGAHRFGYDQEKQNKIIGKLLDLNKKYGLKIPTNSKEILIQFPFGFPIDYNAYLFYKVERSLIKEIKEKFKDAKIWDICSLTCNLTVFYQQDKDLEENKEKGTTEQIKEFVFSRMKEIDELNLYDVNCLSFDSKETLDKKYGGSLQMYFR